MPRCSPMLAQAHLCSTLVFCSLWGVKQQDQHLPNITKATPNPGLPGGAIQKPAPNLLRGRKSSFSTLFLLLGTARPPGRSLATMAEAGWFLEALSDLSQKAQGSRTTTQICQPMGGARGVGSTPHSPLQGARARGPILEPTRSYILATPLGSPHSQSRTSPTVAQSLHENTQNQTKTQEKKKKKKSRACKRVKVLVPGEVFPCNVASLLFLFCFVFFLFFFVSFFFPPKLVFKKT